MSTITTERMVLIPANVDTFRAEMAGYRELSRELNVEVPAEWPPVEVRIALDIMIKKYDWYPEYNMDLQSWYWTIEGDAGTRILIGSAGFFGDPAKGMLMLEYSELGPYRGKGYGTEAIGAMIDWAFNVRDINRIIADTFSRLIPSVRLLEKNGFRLTGPGPEDGSIRYEMTRDEWYAKEAGSTLSLNR